MSIEIPVAFVQKYKDDVIMLSQQRMSRLEGSIRDDPDMLQGKFGFWDRIGKTAAYKIETRHGDTKLVDTPHSRRRIALSDFGWADLIDKRDMRRLLIAGQLPARYRENAIMAMNRQKDMQIIAAASGNAFSIDEDDAATAVPLPAGQKIAAGGAGLTLAKVLQAKEILDGNEVDEELPRTAVVTSKQITNMLNTTEVKSADFNTVKALVAGQINDFLGWTWVRTELLTVDGSGDRLCLFYARNALGLAKGQEIEADIGPRRDKNNSTQVFVDMSMDATRIEDEAMVEVACVET